MTYVSYFPEAKVKPGAPIKQKMTDASKCRAWGPGIEPEGVIANQAADFFVEATGSSKGKVNVSVFGPGRKQIDCELIDNHDNTYSCRYVAPKPGRRLSSYLYQLLKFRETIHTHNLSLVVSHMANIPNYLLLSNCAMLWLDDKRSY